MNKNQLETTIENWKLEFPTRQRCIETRSNQIETKINVNHRPGMAERERGSICGRLERRRAESGGAAPWRPPPQPPVIAAGNATEPLHRFPLHDQLQRR